MARSNRKPTGKRHNPKSPDGLWLYGHHAVRAALANPQRKILRCVLSERAADSIGKPLLARVRVETADGDAVARLLPPGAVHQGAALQCEPLPVRNLEDVLQRPLRDGLAGGIAGEAPKRRIVLVLDQISDPHNTGAILRSAAAFGVAAVVVQDRHAPPETGALAKAASGALDIVPYVPVVNIARALDTLADLGFWRIALAGDGEQTLREAAPRNADDDVAIVLGSEGSGVRRLVRERCDVAAFIPIDDAQMESLNVSNAAAVALYEMYRSGNG